MSFKNYLILASFTFACAQNTLAMRCNAIKAFKFARKANQLHASSLCTKPTSPDALHDKKRLEDLYEHTKMINVNCSGVITQNKPCIHQDSCCRLAKEDAQQAKKGKEIRLKNNSHHLEARLIENNHHMQLLEENSTAAQKILLASRDKAAIVPTYEKLWKLIKSGAECCVHSANIYGCTFGECSERHYEKNPNTIFDRNKHMTPEERAREDLQRTCYRRYKRLMKSNGDTINANILLGWQEKCNNPNSTMHPSEVIEFRAMERLI